ncbi:MAG TPA: hypothetical protein PLJ35_09310 [Anaerolineae bacterium]|nr:hypothetical protein [Anaerolineae bacterium]HOG47344.1 hypothetical protein [Anaerolineae bacterium]HOQ99007.1 hypothetical protein [Anaerolineae bacterium]HPL30617.1 hypothetical protein [Anaerolineae bacterium]
MRLQDHLFKDGSPQPLLILIGFALFSTLAACSLTAALVARNVRAQAAVRLATPTRVAVLPTLAPTALPGATATPTLWPTPTQWIPPTATPTTLPLPTPTPQPLPDEWLVPQGCGMTAETADYGAFGVGTEVILGRHRSSGGLNNGNAKMNRYVGRRATVTELAGVDSQGCPGVRVDVDGGRYFWRVRDLTPA